MNRMILTAMIALTVLSALALQSCGSSGSSGKGTAIDPSKKHTLSIYGSGG